MLRPTQVYRACSSSSLMFAAIAPPKPSGEPAGVKTRQGQEGATEHSPVLKHLECHPWHAESRLRVSGRASMMHLQAAPNTASQEVMAAAMAAAQHGALVVASPRPAAAGRLLYALCLSLRWSQETCLQSVHHVPHDTCVQQYAAMPPLILQADRDTSHPMVQGLLQQACFASSPTWRPCSRPCSSSSSSMVALSRAASQPSISQCSPVQGQG